MGSFNADAGDAFWIHTARGPHIAFILCTDGDDAFVVNLTDAVYGHDNTVEMDVGDFSAITKKSQVYYRFSHLRSRKKILAETAEEGTQIVDTLDRSNIARLLHGARSSPHTPLGNKHWLMTRCLP
jgi:hypothetical protein